MKILIKNISMLDVMDERVLEKMDLVIEGEIIKKIGKNIQEDADEIIDGKHLFVIPGLINSHTHLGMSLLRNLADDLPLHTWLNNSIWPFEAKMNREDIYWGTKLSLIENIRSGATCYCDQYYAMDRVADATLEAGLRGVLTRGLIEDDKAEEKLEETKELYQNYHGKEGRLKVVPSPHAIYTTSPNFLKKVIAMAEGMDGVINIHMSETLKEVEDSVKEYGMTPINYIHSLGMLELHVIAAHCVHITDKEIELIAGKKFYPIYNPTSNLKLASGFTPVQKMLNAGITMGIGTDGSSSNNNQNILEEMHIGSIVNKAVNMDAQSVPAMEIIKMATINGAKALGWEDKIGSIEEGKQADLVFFDLKTPSFTPRNNLISALCYSAQSSDINRVMVAGKTIYKENKVLTLNEEEVMEEVQFRTEKIKNKK
ncbi:MAG: amidohydrolase [Tissierellia bacterium]|nr:amidohydrolase [Tissierellia bacterium]